MLTPQDELLCHQLPTTFDHVSQSDLRWTERIALYGFDTNGSVSVNTGLARYPNRNVQDAYVMITVDGAKAHVVRLSREISGHYDDLASWQVGPYRYEVTEALHTVRATLDDNEHGLRMELNFRGRFPAYEQAPAFFRSRGRVREDARRFYQNGTISGWLEYDGERVDIDPGTWLFGRDHSWGTRHGGGGGSLSEGAGLQPMDVPEGVLYFMGIFEFEDKLVHFAQRETADGHRWHFEGTVVSPIDAGAPPVPITHVDHDLRFRDGARIIGGGTFAAHTADGRVLEFEVTPKSDFWPGLGGYDLYRGYASGIWKGPYYSDGFTADLTDPEVTGQLSPLTETLCRVEHAGATGHGLVEMVCYGPNTRYGFRG
ncbi:hypothetical protein [Nocardia transvalensis]|uniref:hypothetical protein n=1 Tax=Nocardia transvalensis TaxID=37333 RepID=UPI0018942C1D|nr:hypothetical protein [Nocardia transvalensis]MBF6329565.1 hypothetical protein [Nocardia transvalensis]